MKTSLLPFAALFGFSSLSLACSGPNFGARAADAGATSSGSMEAGSPGVEVPGGGGSGSEATPGGAGEGATLPGTAGATSDPPGSGSTLGNSCVTSFDCDDGDLCNGVEQCEMHVCIAGNAAECTHGTACTAKSNGRCVYAESSPWIVYAADDETPAKDEIYATRVAALGVHEPVKISGDLADKANLGSFPGDWSNDGTGYAFVAATSDEGGDIYVVHFGEGLPEAPLMASAQGSGPFYDTKWSPASRSLMMNGANGIWVVDPRDGNFFAQLTPFYEVRAQGVWKNDDEIIHVSANPDTDEDTIWLSTRQGTGWVTEALVTPLPKMTQFRVSPDGGLVSYSTANATGRRSLFVCATTLGSTPQLLSLASTASLKWSSDGSKFLLLEGATPTKLSWGEGPVTTATPRVLADYDGVGASLSPTGSHLLLWDAVATFDGHPGFYDLATREAVFLDETVPHRSLVWAPDGASFFLEDQPEEATKVGLKVGAPDGRMYSLGSAPADENVFAYYSSTGDYLFYEHGRAPGAYVGTYVDMRRGFSAAPIAVPVPGEGGLMGFEFQRGGNQAIFGRRLPNGSQYCSYLDLSGQVAAEPVQVSRAGRIQYCNQQPAK